MSRDLERRLIKMEARHNAERGAGKRIERLTNAELTAAIRACNAKLEEEHGPSWREWLAENDPAGHRALWTLEQEGAI